MFRYYAWAVAQKTLSYVPLGDKVYGVAGYLGTRKTKGMGSSFVSSFRLVRKARELTPPGGTVIDVGSGWFHHDAFLLWLVGDYKIYLFDIADKAKLVYIKNYINHLRNNIDTVARELNVDRDTSFQRLGSLLSLETREDIYHACNFVPLITKKTDVPFLPENSVDFMVSNCVFTHIPLPILIPELKALRAMLKPEGYMYFLIGHDDHWTFHDLSANQFNYYRYSDRYYSAIFDTKFEYQNRFVKAEWLDILAKANLTVADYYAEVTESSREQIARLPHIDARFARYPREELAIIYSYFLLKK